MKRQPPYWWDGLWLWTFGSFPLGVLCGIVIAEVLH